MKNPQTYILKQIDPSVIKPLRAKIKESYRRRPEIEKELARWPVGGKSAKHVIAAAEAEYLRNPSEALREKLQNMVQSPAAAVQQADVMRHAHKKEQTANLIGQVDCIRTIAPHAAKKARTEHAATEKPERDLAEKLGIEYRPSSGVQALAEIADHFHNLANLAPGTKLSEAQVDGFLKSL